MFTTFDVFNLKHQPRAQLIKIRSVCVCVHTCVCFWKSNKDQVSKYSWIIA